MELQNNENDARLFGCWCAKSRFRLYIDGFSQVMIVGKNFAQEVELQHVRSLLVEGFTLLTLLAEDNGILRQMLLTAQMATSTDDTATWDGDVWRHVALTFEDVFFANFQRFNCAADFKNVIRSDDEYVRFLRVLLVQLVTARYSMNYLRIFFYDAILSDDYRTRFGDDLSRWMNNRSTADGHIAFDVGIFAHHSSRHYFNFVPKSRRSLFHWTILFSVLLSSTHSTFDIFKIFIKLCCWWFPGCRVALMLMTHRENFGIFWMAH